MNAGGKAKGFEVTPHGRIKQNVQDAGDHGENNWDIWIQGGDLGGEKRNLAFVGWKDRLYLNWEVTKQERGEHFVTA